MLHDKSPLRRRTEQVVIRWLTWLTARLVRVLPLRWVQALGNAIGALLVRVLGKRRRMALDNLRAALGSDRSDAELAGVVKASVQNMTKTMLELLKFPAMSDEQFARFAPVRGAEHLAEAAARGRGVIVVTPHYGNWEALALRISSLGHQLTVVARDANDPATARMITDARASRGAVIIERDQVREMLRTLRRGDVLGILPDQHGGEGGVWLTFMGRPASTVTGPAALARRTGAAVVPGFARRTEDDTLEVNFLPPLTMPHSDDAEADVRAGTQMVNDVLGEQIRRHPEQWMWMHNRWRTPPEDLHDPEPAAT